ncbi:MAG TPA: hypothetical protein DCY27_11850 [Desulfobacterales bacterium]|nr:hypothetical protein [Desulfobacterales bacterium]
MMKKGWLILLLLTVFLVFTSQAFALTYLPEDAARGGMWANVLVDAGAEYKNADGSFKTGGGWSDAHNLLGPIPTNQDPYSPKHTSIVTMNNKAASWVQLGFADTFGNLLRVNNDPTNPEGYDAIVWGNAFYSSGSPNTWNEPGTIYLSQDGSTWWKLPWDTESGATGKTQTFDYTPGEGDGLVSPGAPWENFVKTGSTWTHTETGLAGGDAFDMSTAFYVGDWTNPADDNPALVGLDWFQYILLTGEGTGGPDPDSVYVFSTSPVPLPGAVLLLGSGLARFIVIFRRKQLPHLRN